MKRLKLCKASAGSGKTYQLALNYITLLLGERREDGTWRLLDGSGRMRHREILAITFTNKATEEMKRRIVRELAVLAGNPGTNDSDSSYRDTLMETYGLRPDESARLRNAARKALSELLYDFNGFNVSTIDAFFQSVLRSFAYEADLTWNYDLELDNKSAIEQGIAETLAEAIRPSDRPTPAGRWLEIYMTAKIDNGEAFNVLNADSSLRTSLKRFVDNLTGEDYQHNKQAIDGFLDNTDAVVTLERELSARHKALRDEIRAKAIRLSKEGIHFIESGIQKTIAEWTSGTSRLTEAKARKIVSRKVFVAASNERAKADKAGWQAFCTEEKADEIVDFLQTCVDHATVGVLLSQFYNFGIFGEIIKQVKALTSENNTILLSETNTLLRDIIGDSLSPFIYERTGLRLHHFLIDEFQDTSRLQWENLRPLVMESLDNLNDNLIIGDVKQCIYRFRNSDPDLLNSDLQADPGLSGRIILDDRSTNYRSSAEVVEFNNNLFEKAGATTGNSSVYSTARQMIRRNAPHGYVDICGWTSAEFTSEALARMIDHIKRQLDPRQGGYRQSDIAILVWSNSEAAMIIRYLLDTGRKQPGLENIHVVSDEAMLIGSSTAVQRILTSLRRAVNTPQPQTEDIRKYTPVTQRQLEWLAEEFERKRQDMDDPFSALSDIISTFKNSSPPDEPQSDSRGKDLFTLTEIIAGNLPDDLKRSDSVYISAFQDLVLEYSSLASADIYSFLAWWDSTGRKRAISSAPSVDAIRVMTIHKSKGLEFPCVHIPLVHGSLVKEEDVRWYDATAAFQSVGITCPTPSVLPIRSSESLAITPFAAQYEELCRKSLLDNLNMLYVAFTRAANELIVSCNPTKNAASAAEKERNKARVISNALGIDCKADESGKIFWQHTSGEPTANRQVKEIPESGNDRPGHCDMPAYQAMFRPELMPDSHVDTDPDDC